MSTVKMRWVLVMLWFIGMTTAQNVTNLRCGPFTDDDININISKGRYPANSPVKVCNEPGSNQFGRNIYKQININLNLEELKGLSGQKDRPKIEDYRDTPNPFYQYVRGLGYYKLHNEIKSWNEAKSICEKEGAHLAIVNSKEEAQLFIHMRNRMPKMTNDWKDDTLYIGINDIAVEGSWVTIFGEPLEKTGFSEWDAGMPAKGRGGNCGIFRPSTGKLHDAGCDWNFGFYCEKEV